MEDHSNDNQPDFIREKIVGKKDHKKNIIRLLCRPAAGGAVFGLAAALVFSLCIMVFRPYPGGGSADEETETVSEETETRPEDIMPENKEELEKFVSQIVEEDVSRKDAAFYEDIREAVKSLEKSMVTVVAVKKDVDWFEVSYDSRYSQSGIVIKKESDKFYILTGYTSLRGAAVIQMEFSDGTRTEAQLEGYDTTYDIAVISAEGKNLSAYMKKELTPAAIGNTSSLSQGTPVFAIGNPDGSEGSVGIGFISLINHRLSLIDGIAEGIQSSVPVNGTGCSFLMGIDGAMLGIYTGDNQNLGNGYSQAYAINRVMTYVNRIYRGEETAGLGITGQDIDEDIRQENDIPEGIYVTDVKKDSASYGAGVQAGDVLGEVDGQTITSMEEYEAALMQLTPDREVKMIVYRSSQGAYKKMELKITPTVRQG
ncbi:MAG: S1C family serine protease [Lachnospiraceae bacterium]